VKVVLGGVHVGAEEAGVLHCGLHVVHGARATLGELRACGPIDIYVPNNDTEAVVIAAENVLSCETAGEDSVGGGQSTIRGV
jgi:hypothetical protein